VTRTVPCGAGIEARSSPSNARAKSGAEFLSLSFPPFRPPVFSARHLSALFEVEADVAWRAPERRKNDTSKRQFVAGSTPSPSFPFPSFSFPPFLRGCGVCLALPVGAPEEYSRNGWLVGGHRLTGHPSSCGSGEELPLPPLLPPFLPSLFHSSLSVA